LFFTADTHFYHRAVIGFCDRPWYNVAEMNEGLIDRWNSKIGKRDHVYILGDFAFCGTGKAAEIVRRLNGYKILVRGNHDPRAKKLFAYGFDEVRENSTVLIGDERVFLSHFPYHPVDVYIGSDWGNPEYILNDNEDTRYLHKRILDDGTRWLLHGHVHTSWKIREERRMINVGVDMWDWSPVHHDTIRKIIEGAK